MRDDIAGNHGCLSFGSGSMISSQSVDGGSQSCCVERIKILAHQCRNDSCQYIARTAGRHAWIARRIVNGSTTIGDDCFASFQHHDDLSPRCVLSREQLGLFTLQLVFANQAFKLAEVWSQYARTGWVVESVLTLR